MSEASAKDGLKLRCENVKLFLREPLVGLGLAIHMALDGLDCLWMAWAGGA